MTYAAIAAVLMAASGIVAFLGARRLAHPAARRRHWLATALTAVVLVALTAVFDNLMIAADIMEYDLTGASGILVGKAPLEDFSYSLACALAIPGLWALLYGVLLLQKKIRRVGTIER